MSRYELNPAATQANFEIFDKGSYEIIIDNLKPFVTLENNTPKNWGIRATYRHADNSKYAGKKGVVSFWLHNDGSISATKRFQMAMYGYPVNAENEEKFNENEGKNLDWGYDPDTGDIGEGWKNMKGGRVIADMDVQPNKNDQSQMMQQFKGWRPVSQE